MDKFASWIVFLIVILNYSSVNGLDGNVTVRGIEIPIPTFQPRDNLPNCPNTTGGQQCVDCHTLLFCRADSNTAVGKFICPPSLKYCNNGECSEERSITCADDYNSVTCPAADGYYPDPSNCSIYYYCDEDKKATAAYACPSSFPFSMASGSCAYGPPCTNINCDGKVFAVNPGYPRLGALCYENEIVPGSYKLCKRSARLDESLNCKATCIRTGNIPHETNANQYYTCLPTGPWGALVKTLQTCPPNLPYDDDKGKCTKP